MLTLSMNKLTYMTDSEVSAYGVYQDGKLPDGCRDEGTGSLVKKLLLTYKSLQNYEA